MPDDDENNGEGEAAEGEPDPGEGEPEEPVGPAANLECESSGNNAFTTYGANAFVAVNEAIFANVDAELEENGEDNIGGSFALVGSGDPPSTVDDLATFKGKLAAFLVFVYGGPTSIEYTDGVTYRGDNQDMVAAHTGLAIQSAQYDYFVTNIVVPALVDNGVPNGEGDTDDDVTSCFAPPLLDAAFKATIVGH